MASPQSPPPNKPKAGCSRFKKTECPFYCAWERPAPGKRARCTRSPSPEALSRKTSPRRRSPRRSLSLANNEVKNNGGEQLKTATGKPFYRPSLSSPRARSPSSSPRASPLTTPTRLAASLRKENDRLREQIDIKAITISRLNSRIDNLNNLFREEREKNGRLRKENDTLRRDLDRFQKLDSDDDTAEGRGDSPLPSPKASPPSRRAINQMSRGYGGYGATNWQNPFFINW